MARQTPKKIPARKAEVPAAPKAAPPRDNIDLLESLPLTLTAEVGRTRETVQLVQRWGEQSLIELDQKVGDAVDIRLNGQLFARGEVVTVEEYFGVRITEIVERPA
ncbi:MAG: FliM/FliN family flagellar motor switch protein [Gemmatimonadota bacterium]